MSQAADELICKTDSAEATLALGRRMGGALEGGLVIGLVGPLGAGKTQLVKGIAAGNAVDDAANVTSPTFALVHQYPGRLELFHLDVYRLEGPADVAALGFDEWVTPTSVLVVEWADAIESLMPDDALWIELRPIDSQRRGFTLRAGGGVSSAFLDRFRAAER
ncbi:MAG: tRNA (adenosine(37)-N6)-threonylcarbamoyltransferase complex ATPase subunit type 1 TsaE [Phycisphaerae bacterium]